MRFPKTLSLLFAFTVALAALQVAAPQSAQAAGKTYISFAASPTTRTSSQSSTLTAKYYKKGKLQKSGKLYLQYKSGKKWVTVRTLKVSSKGTAKTTVKPSVNRTYRVVTAKSKVKSSTKSVKLKNGFTIKASKSTINDNDPVKFTASNFKKGKARTGKVQLQFYKDGKWRTAKTLTLKKGTASFTRKTGATYKWRFRYPSSGAVTKTTTVTVKPKISLSASASEIAAGKSVSLTVSLQRHGNKVKSEKVTLQSNEGSGWKNFKTVTVSSGNGKISFAPAATAQYRVAASGGLNSSARTIKVNGVIANKTYWVKTDVGLNLRSGAGTNFSSILPKLSYGAKVTSLQENPVAAGSFMWVNIRTTDGREGWVADEYLASSDPTATTNGLTNKSFTITGSGFGHGIGMSQYGAYQMAREGNNASEILRHYYTGVTVANQTIPDALEDVRVQVLGPATGVYAGKSAYHDSYTTRTLTFSSPTSSTKSTWRLRSSDGTSLKVNGSEDLSTSLSLRLTKSSTKVKAEVLNSTGSVVATHTDSLVRIHLSGTSYYHSTSPNTVVSIPGANGSYNNGRLEVSVIGGVLNISNQLKLNSEYLYGIAEMPSSWGSNSGGAALEAQAIAARTYALGTASTTVSAACNCNLVDDIRHQNFTGWNKQGEGSSQQFGKLWKAAVDRTINATNQGDVVKYNGKYISTYYYSASGGGTANSEDVWSSALAYTRSVTDPYSLNAPGNSNKAWTKSLTQAQARGIFSSLPDVAKLEVTAKYAGGLVKTVRATATNGQTQTLTKKADTWRSLFGTKAAWITKIAVN